MPAAVRSPAEAEDIAASLAQLMGCWAGILGTSPLHVFWDLFCILCRRQSAILIVGEIYPIALWGIERAAALGVPVARVAVHDPERVSRCAQAWSRRGIRPITVTDGISFPAGRVAPLGLYARIAAANGGLLVIDDTQAVGILGSGPTACSPYGRGGGGSFRFHGLAGPHLFGVCSLAKAFAVPVAVLAGSRPVVRMFATKSATRRHSSPPSMAVVAAAARTIDLNRQCGERLRAGLWDNIRRFRRALASAGLQPAGGLMPVQTLSFGPEREALSIHQGLTRAGIRALGSARPGSERRTCTSRRHGQAPSNRPRSCSCGVRAAPAGFRQRPKQQCTGRPSPGAGDGSSARHMAHATPSQTDRVASPKPARSEPKRII